MTESHWLSGKSTDVIHGPVVKADRPSQLGLSAEVWIALGVCILLFLMNRYFARPWVHTNVAGGPILIVVNSIPNFVEAITGTVTLAGLTLSFQRLWKYEKTVYVLATSIAGLFVFASELNWFTYRGPNISDINDLFASAMGLVVVFFVLWRYGIFDVREEGHHGGGRK